MHEVLWASSCSFRVYELHVSMPMCVYRSLCAQKCLYMFREAVSIDMCLYVFVYVHMGAISYVCPYISVSCDSTWLNP